MNIKLTLISLMTLVGLCASAINVTSTPGNLASIVAENVDETTLVISGEINAADIEFIANKMTSLTTLDLSEATIVAYSGSSILLGGTEYNSNTIPAYALAGSSINAIILPQNLQTIDEGALSSTKIKSINIPATVTKIGVGAFANCDELISINIPATVAILGSHAFSDCDNLNIVELGIQQLNASTFARCKSLNNVTATSLISIGESAFSNCTALESINFPSSLTTIGASAFQGSGLKTIDFANTSSLDSIGAWAFAQCKSLTTAIMNNNTSKIGEGAFFEDTSLVTFNMPLACTTLPNYIFKGNNNMDTTYAINHNVTNIGAYALMDWIHVTSFTLPNSLEYIGDNAFEGWTSLKQLNAEGIINEVPELGENVWNEVSQDSVYLNVAADMAEAFLAADQWKNFKINGVSSVENIIDNDVESRIFAYFDGFDLVIKSYCDICQVNLYDSSARQYATKRPNNNTIVINTSDWNSRFYIVKALLADGTIAVIKVARQN